MLVLIIIIGGIYYDMGAIFHRECESCLGVSMVQQVMELLNRADPEEAEVPNKGDKIPQLSLFG